MDIFKIESFLCLAENLNFTKSAEKRHISQPTMSAHISSLENELGFQLFTRDKPIVKLTPAGESLSKDLKEVVSLYYAAIDQARSASLGKNTLRVGYHGPINWMSLPSTLKEFQATHPDIRIMIQIGGHSQLIRQIMNNTLDAIIIESTEVENDPRLEAQFLFSEPLCIFAPKDHSFIEKSYWLSEFKNENFIMVDEAYAPKCSQRGLAFLKEAGIDTSNIMRLKSYEEVMSMAASGNGLAFFPASFANDDFIIQITLKDDHVYNNYVLAWKKNKNDLAVSMLRDMIVKRKW